MWSTGSDVLTSEIAVEGLLVLAPADIADKTLVAEDDAADGRD